MKEILGVAFGMIFYGLGMIVYSMYKSMRRDQKRFKQP